MLRMVTLDRGEEEEVIHNNEKNVRRSTVFGQDCCFAIWTSLNQHL